MKKSLDKLRDELENLQKNERDSITAEKDKILKGIREKV